MRYASITGTGSYVPERRVDNKFFDEKYKQDISSFLVETRNIHYRHFMAEDQATSDLIVPAAEQAIANAGLKPTDLDLIIVATDTPDYVSPSTASVVQYKVGARNAGVFDLNCACAGFVTAIDTAGKFIQADSHYENILVVGAYGMTKFFDWEDYKVTSIFADGAGAAVVSATEKPGILSSVLYADGMFHDYMGIYAGGTAKPISHERIEKGEHHIKFCKKIPIETNATHWPRLVHTVLDRIHRRPEDVKCFFFTQINIASIGEALKSLTLPSDKSHNVMDKYGYTGSACIPMAVHDAVTQHKLKKGDLVVAVGSGGGMSMASVALEWSYDT